MSPKKILVVDDDTAILNLLKQVFSKAGYQTYTAQNSNEALNLLDNEVINVMFFDLNMPEINGLQLCKEVKKKTPISLIYAITGYASLFQLAECREVGFEDYFIKPVNIKTLLKIADDAFEKLDRWRNIKSGSTKKRQTMKSNI